MVDERAVGAPGLAAHRIAKAPVHRVEALEHDRDRRRPAEHGFDLRARIALRLDHFRRQQRPDVGRPQQSHATFGQRCRVGAEQHVGDARERRDVAREPAAGVEARREVVRALEADAAVRRTQADRPQWLAGARTEPPVSLPSAKSTSPCDTAEAEPDDEPPVMRSGAAPLTGEPKCAFWPFIENASSSVIVLPAKRAPASSRRCTLGRRRRLDPRHREHERLAGAGRIAGDVEQILDAEREPRERTRCGVRHGDVGIRHEAARAVSGVVHASWLTATAALRGARRTSCPGARESTGSSAASVAASRVSSAARDFGSIAHCASGNGRKSASIVAP